MVFGIPSQRPKSGNRPRPSPNEASKDRNAKLESERSNLDERFEAIQQKNDIEEKMGFARFVGGAPKCGWLINMHPTLLRDEQNPGGRAAVNFFFIQDDGEYFVSTIAYDPYFLLSTKPGFEAEVEECLRKRYNTVISKMETVEREDLDLPNHLLGRKRRFLKISFTNVGDLLALRRELQPIVERAKKRKEAHDIYSELQSFNTVYDEDQPQRAAGSDQLDNIDDIREYDVPYQVRVAIDLNIRIGKWYQVTVKHGQSTFRELPERVQRAEPVVMAFDIETTKSPLKFPDRQVDCVMMISYMIDGQGFLITNREIVSQDIDDFEYNPRAEYEGPFTIFNEKDEQSLLARFFEHIQDAKPTVMVTYNGDFFDWPFVEARAAIYGIDMYEQIGFAKDSEEEYKSSQCSHLDCFRWVKRDSYLPQGSQGLKAVTTAKLGYDPLELDPELMTPYASEQPQTLAQYSVSDAVATYYLYMKYVHPFIFSLCNIIPLNPDEVLRKGTGTLCEMLLMVQAYQCNILLPHKHTESPNKFYEGHILESETYVGGHVESLEAGVFRKDIPENFRIDKAAVDELVQQLRDALVFTVTKESKVPLDEVENFGEVEDAIKQALNNLKETPEQKVCPRIYHLDVASMYPNIMITNRLQPDSMVDEGACAVCDFNVPGKTCDRRMVWSWRGEYFPATKSDYRMLQNALENEQFPGKTPFSKPRRFDELPESERTQKLHKRLADYSRKIYHKIHDSTVLEKEAIICQRENPFYINTVKSFRDRRYEFKGLQKVWKKKTDEIGSSGDVVGHEEAKKMIILYDSLQLAHKVILNSFYGYVMRKGSRWYSMEMAGVTCLTGAKIIQMARALVERIGRPLELDTDGIWCILPETFPGDFCFKLKNGGKLPISYPCVMLNHLVHDKFTNHQYAELSDPQKALYDVHSENSIFFEVDGPYRAMILPASKEEDKNLKKRYAVFNDDGSLAELKGFEVKRRGELKLVKTFQTQIFKVFLAGKNLDECYREVAKVANRWLDVLFSKGQTLSDIELIDLICENKSMSKTLEEYGAQKSTSITTARRLGEFLGEQMIRDKGLSCKYIISARPRTSPVAERAIPVDIFSAEENIKRYFLRKWLKDTDASSFDIREVLDWDYYLERLGSVVQKIISIPAAMQKISNPVPRVALPDWLDKRIVERDSKMRQNSLTSMFKAARSAPMKEVSASKLNVQLDIEDSLEPNANAVQPKMARAVQKRKDQHSSLSDSTSMTSQIGDCPSLHCSYQELLQFERRKWKFQKEARVRRQRLFGKNGDGSNESSNIGVQRHMENLSTLAWDILQIEDVGLAGEISAWIWMNSSLQKIRVKVPREFYVSVGDRQVQKQLLQYSKCEPCNVVLANEQSSDNIFKVSVSEKAYQDPSHPLRILLSHESVDGIHELEVPRDVKTIIENGCRWRFTNNKEGSIKRGLDSGFEIQDFDQPNVSKYLSSTSFGFVYCYFAQIGRREVYAVGISGRPEIDVYIVTNEKDGNVLTNPSKIYSTILQHLKEKLASPLSKYSASASFNCSVFKNHKKLSVAMSKSLSTLSSSNSQPTFVVLESVRLKHLVQKVAPMSRHPVLYLSSNHDDKISPLGWQDACIKQMVNHFFVVDQWIQHRISMARFGNVPVGNLPVDENLFLTDIAFARRLRSQRVALWWSSNLHSTEQGSDALESLELNRSKATSNVCIDIDVKNLAISGILTYILMNEVEGSGLDSIADLEGAPTEGLIKTRQSSGKSLVISVFKDMVRDWWQDSSNGDFRADRLVQHLVRWSRSPKAHMHSQTISKFVHEITKKAFFQLSAEFAHFGSKVIYANSNRFLVETSKPVMANAYPFGQYVLKAIKAKPIFNFLDLNIREYWDVLVWYDETNYGGKSSSSQIATEGQDFDTIMSWHLKKFVPPSYQPDFLGWIHELVEELSKVKKEVQFADRMAQYANVGTDPTDTFAKGLVSDHFHAPMVRWVKRLQNQYTQALIDGQDMTTFTIPELPGFAQTSYNHILGMIKDLTVIFGLVRSADMEVRSLKKEMLDVIDVREFSKEAAFVYPSEVLKVDQINCAQCGSSLLLDLCRDEALFPETDERGTLKYNSWSCSFCDCEVDRLGIEEVLIEKLRDLVTIYQTQDIRCSKCNSIKTWEMQETCQCSGQWTASQSSRSLRKLAGLYSDVAKFHQLKCLEMAANELLESI